MIGAQVARPSNFVLSANPHSTESPKDDPDKDCASCQFSALSVNQPTVRRTKILRYSSHHSFDYSYYISAITGLFVLPILSVAFSISFAALVFKGPLAPFLGQGISLVLLGAAILGFVGSLLFSYRGTVCGPQDVTTILIGGAALSIAEPLQGSEQLLITIIVFIGLCSILAGGSAFLFGKLKLGFVARFVPYPVIGGFLAATGYLLSISALGMMLGHEVTVYNFAGSLFASELLRWLPWMFCAALVVLLLRLTRGVLILPAIMLGSIFVFYLVLYYKDLGPADVETFLLGPFNEMELSKIASAGALEGIQWHAIVTQVPTIIAVVGLTVLGTLLNSTGLELTINKDNDLEADLRAAGISNIAAGFCCSLPGYQLLGETLLARNFGLRGPIVGICAAGGCLLALMFGATLLAYIPIGAVAMLIAYLGIDLLVTWLWDERRRLSRADFGVVLLILLIAALVGFLEALAVGVFAAMAIFVMSYARLEVVRLRTTAATRRSRVERSDAEIQKLSDLGSSAVILELTGYIFFGSANTLTDKIREEVDAYPRPNCIILDFSRLLGFDASAGFAFRKLVTICRNRSIRCVFSGMKPELERQYLKSVPAAEKADLAPSLDHALLEFENTVLQHHLSDEPSSQANTVLAFVERVMASDSVPLAISSLKLESGELLVEQGSVGTDIYVLREGSMRAEVCGIGTSPVVVARFLPGALIGELAYYASTDRTATLIADEPCSLFRLEPDKLTLEDADLIGELHGLAASHIARRLICANQLLRDAQI